MHGLNCRSIWFILLALILPSNSFYIKTYNQNLTANNGDEVQIFYQPSYCINASDTYDPSESFIIQVQAEHLCLPNQTLAFTLSCPSFCSIPNTYLNCTNTFTGENQTLQFTALITMNSTTNSSHNAAANFTKIVTWKEPSPGPSPEPDNNSSSDWPIYVGAAAGGLVLVGVGIVIVRRIQKRRREDYERI